MFLEGCTPYIAEDAEKYERLHWWTGLTFSDLVDKAADIYPWKEALVDQADRLTYSELRERIERLAIGFLELGIQSQDRVLLQLPNWNEFVYSYFALQKIGAIPVLVFARYRQHEINHICNLTDARAWIAPEKYQKTDYLPIIDDVLQSNPQTRHVILVRGQKHERYLNLESIMGNAERTGENLGRLSARKPDHRQIAHMGLTGGTMGLPKAVPHIHSSYLCKVEYAARAWEQGNEDICLIAAPAAHDLIFMSGVCGTIFTFGKLVMLDSTDTASICMKIQKEMVSAVVLVPTMASRLVDFDDLKNYDLSSLKKMHCGGGASSAHLIRSIIDRLGCTYFNGYGGTEGMISVTRKHYDVDYIHQTVGRPACPYDIYKIVDDNERELPADTLGELVVKGPCIFTGYYRSPAENEKIFTKEGFFRTGDQAKINSFGDIVISGRFKEIIKRGGESISAVEIENLIIPHPKVRVVAVIGMPDADMGEKVCAYVQPVAGADLNFDQIIDYLKSKQASVLQFPERIEFVKSIPLTKAGKLDKQALREDITKKIQTGSGKNSGRRAGES